MFETAAKPGTAWLEIVRRSTPKAFALAFTENPMLEATCVQTPVLGISRIFDFFQATRTMYERIEFVHQSQSADRIYLEWQGLYQAKAISGATILSLNRSVIEHIRLYHYPYEQLIAFAVELKTLLPPTTNSVTTKETP